MNGPINIQLINNQGGGYADRIQVPAESTLSYVANKYAEGNPENYNIRVNKEVQTADYALKDGDRVTITPNKMTGA